MTITLITPTGGRPEAFSLCEKYMARQTVAFDQWIVIDDYPEATSCTMGQEIYRPEPLWAPGDMTLPRNVLLGLWGAKSDYVFIIEDDDWYAPNYLEKYLTWFAQGYDMVGEGYAKYYNVRNFRFMGHSNKNHASLCQTAFTRNAVKQAINVTERKLNEKFLDIELWGRARNARVCLTDKPLCVGIKGMSGRPGAGYGHSDTIGQPDRQPFTKLVQWIGEEDTAPYREISARLCRQES